MKFTEEQQKVIDSRNCDLLVSAAAGSGKTAVLVERVIERLTREQEQANIDRFLVVTFTNAAAAEMRERIAAAVEKKLLENPHDEHLQRQQLLLHSASIMTIHSFCLRLLREYFHILNLDPGFRMADEAELTLLRTDLLSELLEQEYEQGDAQFFRFVECYAGSKTDQALEDQILRLYRFAESYPWTEEWLAQTERLLFADDVEALEAHPCMQVLLDLTKRLLQATLADTDRAMHICMSPMGPATYLAALADDKERIEALLRCNTYAELSKAMVEVKHMALSRKKQECDEEKKELVKQLRDGNKKVIKKLQEDYFFQTREEIIADLQKIREPLLVLVRLTKQFATNFQKAKRERNILDFSDLEHLAVALLCEKTEDGMRPSKAAEEIRTRFDEIMIDEYQDSNLIQECILQSISGESIGKPNRFMVGDVKQSIYKFRMARPELFLEKYHRYEDEGSYVRIDLHKNFRSRKSVLDSINGIFEPVMQPDFGGICYDDAAALHYGASFLPDTVAHGAELLSIIGKKDGDTTAREREAYAAAQRIKELVEGEELRLFVPEKVQEDGSIIPACERPVEYKDITVLFRAMKGWSDTFLEVFAEQGIPAYADTQSGYFESKEVKTMLNLLRCLDNPKQDIPLAAVLHSELAGFTSADFARLRYEGGTELLEEVGETTEEMVAKTYRKKLYTCLKTYEAGADAESQELKEKIDTFFAWYEAEREKVQYLPVSDLLEDIYQTTGYDKLVRVMPLGERRVKNLELLVVKAKQFEKSSYTGLFDFIRYIDRLIRSEVDFGEAAVQGDTNAVRFMSIHKSKGLEFPVVLVAGMEKQFNKMDSKAKLVLHADLGIGADYMDPDLRVKSSGFFKKIIARKLNEEMLTEELRIFYVALTRAKEKLILMADFADEEEWKKLWQPQEDRYKELIGASCYLDFLKLSLQDLVAKGLLTEHKVYEENVVKEEAKTLFDGEEAREALVCLNVEKAYSPKLSEQLEQLTNYTYPFEAACTRKGKVTVSELKRQAYEEPEETIEYLFAEPEQFTPTLPKYMQKEEVVQGASRGTLYHRIMECLDFTKEYTNKQAVKEAIAGFVAQGLIREDSLSLIRAEKIVTFFRSPLGKEMQMAAREGRLKKEQPFVIGIPATELEGMVLETGENDVVAKGILEKNGEKEKALGSDDVALAQGTVERKDKPEKALEDNEDYVLVQGILDACFETEEGLVLVDYKTDYIPKHTKEELCKRYASQLDYYARALWQISGKKVVRKMIYSFYSEEGFVCE